ncbi:hypothetical protein CAPTEDRAFT_199965 [Capitella teleta]|uniref:Carbohydrate kinase PfkB domain-containing protein n=1 Tax=Capitella teleta TaxID=283909 RepID=R7U2C9_CAPTE|nr:hypothetical protein CAPTEDRAFT_199965 [Capitella teleta]|eukprot:ELT97310.1 hypothetical protein CAPTEDRAFT_199965 [Capitella teleta]
MATLAKSHEITFLLNDLAACNIGTDLCVEHEDCATPVSIGIINKQNGSRTIIHSNPNLPEISFIDFTRLVDMTQKWIHFEGRRNVEEIEKMLQHINDYNKTKQNDAIVTSVEIEKRNPELVKLCSLADYIFISKEHAMMQGIASKEDAVRKYLQYTKNGAAVICAWGETGAAAKRSSDPIVACSCYPPEIVVDTLGAGDTFVAASISVLSSHESTDNDVLLKAIDYGCRVAGAKCGGQGFDHLKELFGKKL